MMNVARACFAVLAMSVLLGARGTCGGEDREVVAYSELKGMIARGAVAEVTVAPTAIEAQLQGGQYVEAVRIEDPTLLADLEKAHVRAVGTHASDGAWLVALLTWLLPLGLIVFVVLRVRRGPGGLAVGQSRPKLYAETKLHVRFDDVAGVDEAKEELREVIDYLRAPTKFEHLGGHLPKGILLVGPPGTGKTLLARAVAGEAAVPFLSINGSEFVEMFVGVGAARVRDLFAQARARAPCIIFVDELDALGKVRGVGPGAHEEREQTLNQLLVEMDGFDPRTGIIMMAATNRPEILDPALLRSGRFDRHVLVDRPDLQGRLAILRVHARKVRLAQVEDLATIAQMTPGLVGADLANVINEAALLAVRRGHEAVLGVDLEEAVERIEAGLEKKNRILSAAERERVARHEIGHALVALSLPRADPVQKISIIPRGVAALGYTRQVPTEERFLMTQSELEDRIAILLGGRVAEDLCFHEPSTGAQDDLRKATDIARSMVRAHGMNRRIGLANLEPGRRALWIDAESDDRRGQHSEHLQRQVDAAVEHLLESARKRVAGLLGARIEALEAAATVLLLRETLSGDELRALVAAHPPSSSESEPEPAPESAPTLSAPLGASAPSRALAS